MIMEQAHIGRAGAAFAAAASMACSASAPGTPRPRQLEFERTVRAEVYSPLASIFGVGPPDRPAERGTALALPCWALRAASPCGRRPAL